MAERQVLFLSGAHGEALAVERAEGAYLYTRDGRKLLDGSGGAIVVNIGQGRSELADLARAQLLDLNYVLPLWVSPARERLVARLARWTPAGIDRFFFTSGGSESVESALKFAFLYHRVRGDSGGVLPPVPEYWPRIAEICRRNDIVLIADEVMTGFGRTGKRFAVEHWG